VRFVTMAVPSGVPSVFKSVLCRVYGGTLAVK
jgi:hypothetical protein